LARGYLHKFNTRITKRRGEVGRGQVDNYVHIRSKRGQATYTGGIDSLVSIPRLLRNLKIRALYTMKGITGKNSISILVVIVEMSPE
jgi:hypothetical protein